MINRLFLSAAVLFFVLSVPLSADEGDFGVGADIGGVGLIGNGMSAYGTNGFGFGGYLTYAASEMFELDLNLIDSPHSANGNKANALYGTLGLKFGMTFDQLMPYLTGGVGFYRNSVTLNGVSGSAASFGFNLGGGMDIDVGKFVRIGLLVRYHPVFEKNTSFGAPGVNDFWDALLRVGFLFRTGIQGGWN